MTGTKFGFIHTYIHTYIFKKPIILTQEPQKHRNSSKSLIRKFSPLQSFHFEKTKSDERVLEYANTIRELGTKINELKELELNISEGNLATFKTQLEADILSSFRKGLKQEIQLELGEQVNAYTAIQKAIEIESNLAKQNMLRNDTENILFNFEKLNSNVGRISQC